MAAANTTPVPAKFFHVKWTHPDPQDPNDLQHIASNQQALVNLYRYTAEQLARLAADCSRLSIDPAFYTACSNQALTCAQEISNAFMDTGEEEEEPVPVAKKPTAPKKPRKPRAKKAATPENGTACADNNQPPAETK